MNLLKVYSAVVTGTWIFASLSAIIESEDLHSVKVAFLSLLMHMPLLYYILIT